MKQILQLIRPFREMRKIAALCLAMVMTLGAAWGQNTTTESVTLSNGTFSTDHITWTCANNAITIQQLKGTSGTAVNSSYISAPRVYKGHVLSFVGSETCKIKKIEITVSGTYYGNSMTAGTVFSNNTVTDNTTDVSRTWASTSGGTHVVSSVSDEGLPAIYIQNVASSSNTQLRFTALSITYIISGTQPTTYTVTYHANVTGVADIEETYNEGGDVTIADNTFTNPGYAFTEWNTEEDGSGDSFSPGDEITDIDDDWDLYAQWEVSNEMTLTFALNSNPGDWPTTQSSTLTEYTYDLDGVDYTFALQNVKCSSGYLMVYYVGAVGLPAIEGYKLTKVVASNSGGCSTSVIVGISSSASQANYIAGGAAQTWSTQGSQYTYNLTATDANTMYYLYVTNKNAQVTSLTLTYEAIDADAPSITASDVDITYDATSGSIAYTIENEPSPAGELTASTTANWLTLGTVTSEAVPFTCTENDNVVSRTATVTLTYTYNEDVTVTKDIIVTQGVDATLGTASNPYTVAQARAFIDGLGGSTSTEKYVSGIISQIDSYNSNFSSITYWISDDGTTTNQLEVYSGKGIDGANFNSIDDVELTAEVVVKGNLKKYNTTTYEFTQNNELVVYNAPQHDVEAPVFSPVAGTYASAQSVTISCETTNATIYYTLDGTEPTNASTEYTTAISVESATTIKAIAYVGNEASTVATATYHINSVDDPYTVTEALAFAEYQYPANGIYVTGIVSTAPTAAPTNSGQLTYYISVDGEANNQLEVYKGLGLNEAAFSAQNDIQVGDIVTIYGNVQVYNDIIEFGTGNYLVSFERPVPVLEEYDLTVSTLNEHINAIYVFDVENQNDPLIEEGLAGTVQVLEGTEIMVSPDVEEGYVLASLTVLDSEGESVQPENHMSDGGYYSFTMPSGPVTITATAVEAQDYELFIGDLVEGDYIIYYNGYVLKNTAVNGRLSYETVSPEEDVIATGDATIVWHIAPSATEGYWTIYSDDAQAYAASTGVKNKAQMLADDTDDKALWSVTTEEGTYEFTNKNNYEADPQVNYLLRNNGTNGFACYAEQTGGALSLYKKVEEVIEVTVTITGHTLETTYDGESHLVSGYDVVISDSLYTENDFTFSGTAEAAGTVVGTTYMNLEGEFQNTNPAFAVTFLVTDGYVTIEKALMTVEVTGETATETYDGEDHFVSGYSLNCEDGLYDSTLVSYGGNAMVEGVTVGTYAMGLDASLFSYGDTNIVVTFDVTDGWLTITPACEKIALDENGRWFQNFDTLTTLTPENGFTGVTMGDCWTWNRTVEIPAGYVDTVPQMFYREAFAHSGDYSLRMSQRGVYAMPELDESIESVNQLAMSFYIRQPFKFYILQVGVMDDPDDPETFVPVAVANNGTSTGVEYFECNFSNYQGTGRYIAFKNVITDASSTDIHSTNYIDDLTLTLYEPATCGTISLGYEEDFENVTTLTTAATGVAPECWDVVQEDVELTDATAPQAYYKAAYAHSGKYSLRMVNRCVYAMPALDEDVDWSDVKLEMYVRQPNKCYQLHVGVWDEQTETFTPVALMNNSTTGIEKFSCNFSNYSGEGRRIAFRNTLNSGTNYNYSYNYIDDITLSLNEPAGSCADGITLPYEEDFDSYTTSTIAATGATPDCWEMVQEDVEMVAGKTPQVYYKETFATSGSYTLRMADRCVYAMPVLAGDVELNTLQLTMNVRQPVNCYQLEVGVWEYDETTQEGVFVPVETINNTETDMTSVAVDFSNYTGNGGRIAFRNSLNSGARYDYSYNYIDDIVLNIADAKITEVSNENVNGVERYLESIAVYPNPTVGELHIGATDVQKVECYNQMGQLVAVYDNESDINISSFADGVYMLRITVPQGVTMRKVVKR